MHPVATWGQATARCRIRISPETVRGLEIPAIEDYAWAQAVRTAMVAPAEVA